MNKTNTRLAMVKHFVHLVSVILCCLLFCQTTFSQEDVMSLKIMTYNIRHGEGMDDVIDLDRQATVIQNAAPDVVGLQEVDSCVKRSGYIPEAAILGNKVGMYATFGGAIPLTGGKYGVAILSKEAPLSYRNIPLPGKEKRTLLVCEFEEYVFATTHLDLDEECRLTSLDIILEEAASWEKPFFICGDWNDIPTSTLITKMKKGGFRMLSYAANNSLYYTFPARSPNKIIDYIASYGKVFKSIKSRKVINEPEASDHRPVVVELTLDRYTTGILSPSAGSASLVDEEIYDISGKRIVNGKLSPGLYVLKNRGHKILVK